MNDSIDVFLKYIKLQKNYSSNTLISYQRELEQFVEYLNLNKVTSFDEVTYRFIRSYLVYLNKKDLKSTSLRHHISVLRVFYRYLIKIEQVQTNPFELVSQPRLEKRLPDFLYLDELDELISSININTPLGLRNVMIIELLYATGIRCFEACNICIKDIDMNNNTIYIKGKGKKDRIVLFNDICKSYIQSYINHERIELLNGKSHDILFVNKYGDPITSRGVYDILKRVCDKSTLKKKIHPHMFRHTFATHMLENGASLVVVQELLGHESLASTEIYTHVTLDKLRTKINENHPSSNKKISENMFKKG